MQPSQELLGVTAACPNRCPGCVSRPARTPDASELATNKISFNTVATSAYPSGGYGTAVGSVVADGDSTFVSS